MVRGSLPDVRLAARKEHSLALVAALKMWFEKQLSMISSGSTLAEDIRYALNHWQGLTRFLEDGRLDLDTNPVENAIRPVCLTRKNAHWALLASIVATCKLNDVDPAAYIAETLEIELTPQADWPSFMVSDTAGTTSLAGRPPYLSCRRDGGGAGLRCSEVPSSCCQSRCSIAKSSGRDAEFRRSAAENGELRLHWSDTFSFSSKCPLDHKRCAGFQ
ncbi:hypothetical protein ACVIYL_009024 [Bradyrhizobium sp. USDA 3315]